MLTGTRNRQIARACLIIGIFLLVSLFAGNLGQTQAQNPPNVYSVNGFVNPGFENNLTGWATEFFDANVGSTIGVDCTRAVAGSCSAKLDIGQSNIRLSNQSQTITFGHESLYQVLPPNTIFDNLTDRADGLNLWVYIQPKFTGYTIVQIRFKAYSTVEMDYVLINPFLGSGSGNSTSGGEAGKPVKFYVLPTPSLSQWNHIMRNVRRDWQAPMTITNSSGTYVLPGTGFQLNETLFRVELEAFYYQDTASHAVYGETVWGDEMGLYVNSTTPPASTVPPDPIPFPTISFQDWTGTPPGSSVTWAVFNSLGLQVHPVPGELVPASGYTLRTYYDGYVVYSSPVTSAMSSPIRLQMFPLGTYKTGYAVFNSTVTSFGITESSSERFTFSADGQGPSLVIVNVPARPLFIEKNGQRISSWTYNSTSQTIAIKTDSLGTFSIVFITPSSGSVNLYTAAGGVGAILASVIIALAWRRKKHTGASARSTSHLNLKAEETV